MLNVLKIDWDKELETTSQKYSMILALVVLSICLLAPLALTILWLSRRQYWSDMPFISKYGSLL